MAGDLFCSFCMSLTDVTLISLHVVITDNALVVKLEVLTVPKKTDNDIDLSGKD